jgi:hypothetical protein
MLRKYAFDDVIGSDRRTIWRGIKMVCSVYIKSSAVGVPRMCFKSIGRHLVGRLVVGARVTFSVNTLHITLYQARVPIHVGSSHPTACPHVTA